MSSARDLEVYARQGFGGRLDLSGRAGLLIVDFTSGFADPSQLGGGNVRQAIGPTRRMLAEFRLRQLPVAHSRIVFADDGSDANVFSAKVRGLLALTESSPASAIVPELAPAAGELVVRKTAPSAFFGTALTSWLVGRRVQVLFVAGVTTSGCVRASVVDAMSAGFAPVVLADCVGDRALGPHDASLFDLQQKYAEVMVSSEALQLLTRLEANRDEVSVRSEP
jgi:maleamate amidohydrolase